MRTIIFGFSFALLWGAPAALQAEDCTVVAGATLYLPNGPAEEGTVLMVKDARLKVLPAGESGGERCRRVDATGKL